MNSLYIWMQLIITTPLYPSYFASSCNIKSYWNCNQYPEGKFDNFDNLLLTQHFLSFPRIYWLNLNIQIWDKFLFSLWLFKLRKITKIKKSTLILNFYFITFNKQKKKQLSKMDGHTYPIHPPYDVFAPEYIKTNLS